MESITLGQIVASLGTITAIAVFFISIFKWYKHNLTDRFLKIEEDIEILKKETELQGKEIEESKQERLILLKGQLASLKGLKELKCNGPVTQGIKDIESYLINKSHE